ncbi:glycoside-pentoside-hexuronide (GPH):cation symporter [Brachybacterium halotolerans subsp. kimchii]|uniref:MFS transporter n=1 Tax=Brachybacterium halotolerans TaxID=2795215 RepID=UPI001E502788|nr:glycoside-pentoside-hexuronide (GPH):cation symporter [Brachybacterium halotolerans]UEJ84306.1 glycoside-pentoside-hexuronide (GPH):cation symporter [Brachybacterium halotolerans subsp. kimchii]
MSTSAELASPPLEAPSRPFGARDRVGYMFGDLGNDFTFLLASSYLMIYFTNVAGLAAAHVGLLFLIARFIDAFTDIGWGRFLDRHTPGRGGRFRPWIGRMAIPVAIASSLMYVPFTSGWDYGLKLAYAGATYLLWGSVFYTTTNIAYGSMASVLTIVPAERASLSVFRGIGANSAGLLVSLVPPLFIYAMVDGSSELQPGRLFGVAVVFSLLAALWYILCWANTTERVAAPTQGVDKPGLLALFRSLTTSRPLLSLIAANILIMLASLLVGTMAAYLWLYHFNDGTLSGPAQLTSFLPGLLLSFVAARLAARFGKKEVVTVSLFGAGILYVLLSLLHISDPWIFIGLMFVAGFGLGFYNLLIWALIGDIIDAEEVRSGHRDDGTVYAVNTWARKVGQAVAGGLGGFALSAIGFRSASSVQSAATIDGIYMVSTLVPGLLYIAAALILLVLYPLGRRKVQENVSVLADRRAAIDEVI